MIRAALLAFGFAALAQPALAQARCVYEEQPGVPRPSPFWSAPPSDLAPGEVVLEVSFENWAIEPTPIPPPGVAPIDRIVTGGSCSVFVTYRVVRVVAGDFTADRARAWLSVADAVYTPDGPRLLVGRTASYAHPAFPGHTFDPPDVFMPRAPPP